MNGQPLIAFYGDDFTGSTDVMESLSGNGVPTVLFLDIPTPQRLARFPDVRAIGVAGLSRSKPPSWMDEHLPPVLEALKALGAPVCHYKVCSTFDSAPETGSIGRAIDIGARIFGTQTVPVVVGAPALRRYQVFGNLFAAAGANIHRIDRHPNMSVHPVTPMTEGDLRLHLAAQTDRSIDIVNIVSILGDDYREHDAVARQEAPGVLFYDVLDERSLGRVGELIWRAARDKPGFCAGSSGVEYALVSYWRQAGLIAGTGTAMAGHKPVERLFVMSGSCSPTTAGQIRSALDDGFAGQSLDPAEFLNRETRTSAVEAAIARCVDLLRSGRSVVAYSAIGAPSASAGELRARDPAGFSQELSAAQGAIFRETLKRSGVTRGIVAGGDTSGGVVNELGIYALTMLAPAAPGAPLCRAHAEEPMFDGFEIVLKGGQMGSGQFFRHIRDGASAQ